MLQNITSLFKTGTSLSFSGRFISGVNCDLPAIGALIDFSDTEIVNDESLILNGAFITRQGVIDATDTSISPNINETNVKCLWSNNTGVPNTQKYLKSTVTTELTTSIVMIDTYYPLAATWNIDANPSHFDMPANGEFRLLSGNGKYQINGDLEIEGNANDVIDIRVTCSDDDGATWPMIVNHISRQVNSFVGPVDVAFFPINFIATIKKNQRLRLEIENKTAARDVTAQLDSYFIITQV